MKSKIITDNQKNIIVIASDKTIIKIICITGSDMMKMMLLKTLYNIPSITCNMG